MGGDLNRFLMSQIWQVPSLLIFIFGLVLSLSGRWRGLFVNFAAAGFAVLLFGLVVSAYHQFAMSARIAEGGYASIMSFNLAFSAAGIAIRVVGFGLLIAAIFAGRTEPRPARGPYNAG